MNSRLLIVAFFMTGVGCSGDDGPSEPGESGNPDLSVTVANNLFDPAALSVPVNSTVTWEWSSGGVAHNVTFQDGTASGDRTSGTFERSFPAAGSYPYTCTLHPGMSGTVTVSTSTGGTGGTGGGGTGGGGGGAYP